MRRLPLLSLVFAIALAPGCVELKKYRALESAEAATRAKLADTEKALSEARAGSDARAARIEELKRDLDATTATLKQVTAERDMIDETNGDLTEALRANKSQQSKMISDMSAEKRALEEKVAALTREREELMARNAREFSRLEAAHNEIVAGLEKEVGEGRVQITQMAGRLTVTVADQIFFESGRADIREAGRHILRKVGGALKKLDDKQIIVAGHTDDVPIAGQLAERYPSNWELSTGRATEVLRYLVDTVGVPAEMLSAAGYGPYRPVATNDTDEGRARNRRIEILLIDRAAPPAPVVPAVNPSTP